MSDPTGPDASVPEWPDVDVIMPIRNEAAHLTAAVTAVRSQEYPGIVRIFLGVGPSDDGTEQVAMELASTGDDLVVVDNPSGITPSALNAAIRAGSAPVMVRVDGHSELSDGYIRRAVETMRRTGAVNVGGLQVPVATTPFEEAVAAATTSWLGSMRPAATGFDALTPPPTSSTTPCKRTSAATLSSRARRSTTTGSVLTLHS